MALMIFQGCHRHAEKPADSQTSESDSDSDASDRVDSIALDNRYVKDSLVAPDSRQTVLRLSDGSRFKTSLYHAKILGVLTAKHKTYYVLSGFGCVECDANLSVYIHSPRDRAMPGENDEDGFEYPGSLDNEDGTPLSRSRLFIGDCLPDYPNAAVWFRSEWDDDGQWNPSVFVAQVRGDSLRTFDAPDSLMRADAAAAAVKEKKCREIPGKRQTAEP